MSEAPAASPLPAPAKRNWLPLALVLVLVLLVGGGGYFAWSRHVNSDNYKAKQELARADQLAADGELLDAAKLYREIGEGATDSAGAAVQQFRRLLGEPLDAASLAECKAVFLEAVNWPGQPVTREALVDRGLELAGKKGDADPRRALDLCALLRQLSSGDSASQEAFDKDYPQLVRRWAEMHPKDLLVVFQLADLHDQKSDSAGVVQLLEPFKDQLSATGAAPMLANAYLAQNRFIEAEAVLEPFCLHAAFSLRQANERLRKRAEAVEGELLARIERGKAPKFDYRAYEAAAPAARHVMRSEYVNARMWLDRELSQVDTVIKSVFNYADLALRRARAIDDKEAARKQLEPAVQPLLALRGTLGDTVLLYLKLAILLHEQGKDAEAGEQLDLILKGTGRVPSSLLGVAKARFEMGDAAEARRLVAEAVDAEKDPAEKQFFARIRARWNSGVDDEIAWLRKADLGQPEPRLALGVAEARRAELAGDDKAAAGHLRDALAALDKGKKPEQSDLLFDMGSACLSVFRLEGDKAMMKRGVALLEESLAKKPADSSLPAKVAAQLYRAACAELATPALDLGILKPNPGLEHLSFLVANAKERDALSERVRAHPLMKRAAELAEEAVKLQPRQVGSYELLAGIALWTHDPKALAKVKTMLQKQDLDSTERESTRRDRIAGKLDERLREDRKATVERWEKLVQRMRDQKPLGASFAAAANGLAKAQLRGEPLGLPPDADALVKLAEEAYAASKSLASADALAHALLYRAHQQLQGQSPEYKEMAQRVRRVLDFSYMLGVAVTREGPMRTAALKLPDWKRACQVLKERAEQFPDQPAVLSYVLLKATNPEAATNVAAALNADQVAVLSRAMAPRLSPFSLATALEQWWMALLEGKEKEGLAVLRELGKKGMPLPFELGE